MKKFFIIRYSLLLLCSSLISIFTLPELSAQLTFYAETDMQQELYTHPEGDLLAISDTKVAEIANSLSIASGYQVAFFAEANYQGPSLVLSTGEYEELPHYYSTLAAEGGEEGIRALTIGSYKLERSPSDNHVDLWFASEARNGQVSNNAFDQRVEVGAYTAANLIGTPALDEDEGELWPKLWMNAIAVPRGFVVKLSNTAGKSITLANDDKDGHAKTFSTDQFPDVHQNIAKIEVMEARYRIKNVQLESVAVDKGEVQESLHTIMNNEDIEKQSDLTELFQAQASLFHIYHDSPLSVSAPSGKVQLSVKGEALGADDGNKETIRLFEEATIRSITQGISSGHSVSDSLAYEVKEACSYVCPPNSICTTKMTIQPEQVSYNLATTLERIDENNQPVANSTFTLRSKLRVYESKVGECITEEPQSLVGGLPADVTADVGGLLWLTKNLNTSNCEEGFPIDSSNYQASEEGILYNSMALEQCNVCPSGWRLPTKADFKSLGAAGLSAQEVAEKLNITKESVGSSEYLMIDGARVYPGDLEYIIKGGGFTEQGRAGDFHPVRCVMGDTPVAMATTTTDGSESNGDAPDDTIIGKIISMKAVNGKYVSADNSNQTLIANKDAVSDYEKFRVIDAGDGMVGLQCLGNNKYVCADATRNHVVVADRDNPGEWEAFDLKISDNGTLSLKSYHSKYVAAENGGNDYLIADRDNLGEWETFTFENPQSLVGNIEELGGLGGEANIPDSETMLPVGTKMMAGDRIWSPSKSHYAIMQPDGNLCVYTSADGWVWCNMSQGQGNYLVLQDDGNMCVYTDKDRWVWGSQTHTLADKPVGLSIDDSGTLYLQDKDGNQVWKNR